MNAANFQYVHPLGVIHGYFSERGLCRLVLPNPSRPMRPHVLHSGANIVLGQTFRAVLRDYFGGMRVDFADIPLDLAEATPFQRAVWHAAQAIPWGETRSYAEVARALGKTASAARAVGNALARNPVHIVIPCHRVLGTDGSLVNYAAGLTWKRELLALEGARRRRVDRQPAGTG